MLWGICAVCMALWLVSMATSITMGGLAHLFLIAAIALILFSVWQSRTSI